MDSKKEEQLNNTNYPDRSEIVPIVAEAMYYITCTSLIYQEGDEAEIRFINDLARRRYNTDNAFKNRVDAAVNQIYNKFEEHKPKIQLIPGRVLQ